MSGSRMRRILPSVFTAQEQTFYYVRLRNRTIELQYVYLITQFMCRYRKYLPDGDKFQIASAKLFVEQNFLKGPYGPSKISQI